MRSLKSRWREARSGEGVSTRFSGWILLDAGSGRFIYPPRFRVVREIRAARIMFGCWTERLWMLWALGGQGMLHWGTHRWPGQPASSRLASSLAGTRNMMLLLSSAGPYFPWELAGFFWGGRFSLPWSLEGEGGSFLPWSLEGGGAMSGTQFNTFPREVGSHHPFVRPHAVPGV